MKPHLLAIGLIQNIASVDYDSAVCVREELIDLLDTTRNQNDLSLQICKVSYTLLEEEIHVQVQFLNYALYSMYTITLPQSDLLKHLHYNGDCQLIDQDKNRVNVEATLLGLHMVEVSQYVDDICNGRVNYKKSHFTTV